MRKISFLNFVYVIKYRPIVYSNRFGTYDSQIFACLYALAYNVLCKHLCRLFRVNYTNWCLRKKVEKECGEDDQVLRPCGHYLDFINNKFNVILHYQ